MLSDSLAAVNASSDIETTKQHSNSSKIDFLLEELTLLKCFIHATNSAGTDQLLSLRDALPSLGPALVVALSSYRSINVTLIELVLEILNDLLLNNSANCQYFVSREVNVDTSILLGQALMGILNHCTNALYTDRCIVALVLSICESLVKESSSMLKYLTIGESANDSAESDRLYSLQEVLVKCLSVPELYFKEVAVLSDDGDGPGKGGIVDAAMLLDILSLNACIAADQEGCDELIIVSLIIQLIEYYGISGECKEESDLASKLVDRCMDIVEKKNKTEVKKCLEILFKLLHLGNTHVQLLKIPTKKKTLIAIKQVMVKHTSPKLLPWSIADNERLLETWLHTISHTIISLSNQGERGKVKSFEKDILIAATDIQTMMEKYRSSCVPFISPPGMARISKRLQQALSR
jgi:hypothetical protein